MHTYTVPTVQFQLGGPKRNRARTTRTDLIPKIRVPWKSGKLQDWGMKYVIPIWNFLQWQEEMLTNHPNTPYSPVSRSVFKEHSKSF